MSSGTLRRSIVFATEALEPLPALAQAAEHAGLDRVWTTEYVGRDAVARAIAIAVATERIEVATGIAYAFTRPALGMAALSGDAQRISGGRFALGVGSGTRGVRRWYGVEGFAPPAPAMAEYAGAVREGWAADPALPTAPPIYGAVLNPIMARHVARTFDGALLHALALSRVHLRERLMPAIERGAAERDDSGGTPAPLEVPAWVVTSIADDGDEAVERARRQLAFYLVTPSYASVVAGTSWEGAVEDLREAFDADRKGADWGALGRLLPDDAVHELSLAGTPDEVRCRAAELEDELGDLGITELVFQTVGAGLGEQAVIDNCESIIKHLGRTGA